MSDATPTPRPWAVGLRWHDDTEVVAGDVIVALCWSNHGGAAGPPREQADANAALIVRAVNHFDELVAALREWADLGCGELAPLGECGDCLTCRARVLLARLDARPEPPGGDAPEGRTTWMDGRPYGTPPTLPQSIRGLIPDAVGPKESEAAETAGAQGALVDAVRLWDGLGAEKVMHVLMCDACVATEQEGRWCPIASRIDRDQLRAAAAVREQLKAYDAARAAGELPRSGGAGGAERT